MIRHRSTALLAACVTGLGLVLGTSCNPGVALAIANSVVKQESGTLPTATSELNTPNAIGLSVWKHPKTSQTSSPTLLRNIRQKAEGPRQEGSVSFVGNNRYAASSRLAIALPGNLNKSQLKWVLVLVATLAILGVGILFLLKWLNNTKKAVEQKSLPNQNDLTEQNSTANDVLSQPDTLNPEHYPNGHNHSALIVSSSNDSEMSSPLHLSGDNLPVKKDTSLSKIDIVDELIGDLQEPDPQKRRKAIWELAQRGDSRAIQPLVDLMIDSDSQQRNLILEALSQIGTKTLKPMNRALAISLQDDNAQVRKNAIRDLTRIYEVVAQTTQMLYHAADDPNPEVRETARWAIGQLSRIRTLSTLDNLPSSQSSLNLPEHYDQEPPP
ncbi:HEAT repeat domain-containing protein [Microcoleus sp. FACHB-SPT15]|uniref:HEAT repeat domain-containing protein n=1 Tax=Microcoleus sp. FACHB-SPT15 TaxID=2692830 RepID=UPI001780CAC3|nr:HEAT repeat domain-containing protein [Microcoleus sp. FACHB-SPT15]MBD1809068.1 HEAT repeat domain-containing protein [Microcoleus sp. FACHB-SPT15]